MELKEFIKQTIIQIDSAAKEFNKETNTTEIEKTESLSVEFDLAVYPDIDGKIYVSSSASATRIKVRV